MRLSIAAGVAFADFGISGLFAYYLGGKLIVTDSAGKKLVGYLKALGTGETYGSELTGSSDFESTTGWWGGDGTTELSVVAGGQSGNCMRITNPVQDWSQAGATSDLYTKGGLYRVSAYLKSDGGAYYSFSLHEGVSPYTKLTPDSSGSNGSWTLYALYGTILETSASNFLSISTGPMGTFRYVDTSSVKQVLTPSATGVTVTSTPGGTSYNWESEESGFNRNDSSGYTFEIQEASLFSRAEYSRFSLDTLPLSDSIVREYVKAIIAGVYLWENTDTLLLADTVVRQTALTQSTLEWLRLDDTARRSKEARRAVTEGLTLTDLQRRLMERNLSRLDAVFVFDSTKRELRLRRNVSDAMTLFDQIQRRCAASIVSMDTVLLTDNAKRQFVRQARLGDVLPLSDTRVLSVTRMLTALDSLLVGDRVAQLAEAFRKAVEYLAPLADSISAEGTTGGRTYTVQAFDVLDVVDNSGRRAATTRSVMDALAVGDLAGAARSLLRQVADALGIRDERSAALVIQRATVDWLLLTDTRSRRWWHTAIITDRIGLSDAHAAARKLTVFESTVLSDATSATYIRAVIGVLIDRAVTDALAVSDAAVATHFMERKTQDALGVSDTVARRLASARFTLDVLRLDDSVVRTFDHFLIGQVIVRAITDTLDVLDLLQMERKFRVTQTDAVLTADRLARAAMLARVGSDLLDLADLLPSEQRERRWSETDALVLDDRLTRAIDLVLAESVLVTDTLTHTWMQAVVTVLSGIKERVATYLSVKASIRNPLARLLSESHLLPSWSVMRNPLARHVDTIVPYLRTVEVVDMNAAHL
jgi:hypothetical protein